MPTAQELRQNPALREGLTNTQLAEAGLSNTEIQTINAGFNQAFGGGNAKAFREANSMRVDAAGNVVSPVPISRHLTNQAGGPVNLPAGTEFVPTLHQVQGNEIMRAAPKLDVNGQAISTPNNIQAGTVQPATGQAATADIQDVINNINTQAGQVQGTTTTAVDPLQTTQFNLDTLSTIQGQLNNLMDFKAGEVPGWAKGAVAKAEDVLAARGLGASTIAPTAIIAAIQEAALPIAAQDAQTYFQKDLAVFNNEQQVALENFRTRQQNMLTDVSIANATEQFNAASEQQTEQFVASLVAQIRDSNANRVQAMEQFNVASKNEAAALNVNNQLAANKFNAEAELAVNQFNAQLANQREQFNANAQFAVDQSNVLWRRSINTQNTATVNAANQANVQNRFNLSATAQNNLWQAFRDEVSWLFSSSENERIRNFNAAVAANNRDYAADQATAAAIGQFAWELFF